MLDSYVPHGFTRTRTDVPWLTRELKHKCGRKRRMYNKAKRSKQTIHCDIYKEYAKALKKELRQAHWQHINTILLAAEEDSNPKPFWNYIQSQNQDNIEVAPLKSKGRLHTDANDRAKILSDQFKSVFIRDLDPASKDTAPSGPSYPQMPSFNITEAGVQKLLLNINPSKAGGPDGVPAVCWRSWRKRSPLCWLSYSHRALPPARSHLSGRNNGLRRSTRKAPSAKPLTTGQCLSPVSRASC